MSDHYLTSVTVQNPHATKGLTLDIQVMSNVPLDHLNANIKTNAERDELAWLTMSPVHTVSGVVVGGGPSLADEIDTIRSLVAQGARVLAVNGASKYLTSRGIRVDFQVIIDAQQESSTLVDLDAMAHLFASQVHPDTVDAVGSPYLFHLATVNIEDNFPASRRENGGYAIIGGGVSGGNSAACLAYVMGYRDLHVFGMDGSHRDGAGHAYSQPMNANMPTVKTEWGGKTYISSIPMKCAAEKFIWVGRQLEAAGCTVTIYGDGLMPAMWAKPTHALSEKEKYERMYTFDDYREISPALNIIDDIAAFVPCGVDVLDIGCGTGKAAVELEKRGYKPVLIDFALNCRNPEALHLPFVPSDLSKPIPARAAYGYCCDVMEHIPPDQVDAVLHNISAAADNVFFRIEMTPDGMGALINEPLHLSLHDDNWWRDALVKHWPNVAPKGDGVFICRKD